MPGPPRGHPESTVPVGRFRRLLRRADAVRDVTPGPSTPTGPRRGPAPAEEVPAAGALHDGDQRSVLDELLEADFAEPEEVAEAAAVEAAVTDAEAFGHIGPPLDRRSPFWIAMTATFGVAVAGVVIVTVYFARSILLLFGLSLFIAVGLDPVVAWLRRFMPRPVAVGVVILLGLAALAGVAELVVPVLVTQVTALVRALPHYFRQLKSSSSLVGRLNRQYHVESSLRKTLTSGSSGVASGLLGLGRAVLGALASTLVVLVLSVYLLFDLPRFKRLLYGLVPRSRRARTVLLSDQIFAKVGGYVLGNVVISVITGIGTYVWCVALGVPYPLLLAVLVAVFDLVPVVGSTVGGVVVAAVALTVSPTVAVATVGFYLAYRLLEDYLLAPRIMRRTVDVPGLVTVVATLVGGVLLGVIGALVAIPVAAAVKLLLEELAAPRLEQH